MLCRIEGDLPRFQIDCLAMIRLYDQRAFEPVNGFITGVPVARSNPSRRHLGSVDDEFLAL